jgi:hypothetical protein
MNLALHGAVSNDPLLYCLIAWALVLAAIVARGSGAAYPILFGLVAGAAIWTKTTGLMLTPVGFVAGLIGAPKKSKITVALTMAIGPLLVAAPWMIRNVQVYGDPFALRAFTESFGGTAQAKMFIDSIGMGSYLMNWVGWTAAKSFVGTFGYMDISPLEAYGGKAVETFYRVSLAFLTARSRNPPCTPWGPWRCLWSWRCSCALTCSTSRGNRGTSIRPLRRWPCSWGWA